MPQPASGKRRRLVLRQIGQGTYPSRPGVRLLVVTICATSAAAEELTFQMLPLNADERSGIERGRFSLERSPNRLGVRPRPAPAGVVVGHNRIAVEKLQEAPVQLAA